MSIFSFRKKQSFFTPEEEERIVGAIRVAEKKTSGEIRIYVESRCRFVDPLDRAAEIFFGLKMQETQDRNGVLIYLAMKDHQLAIFGDEGIHQRVGGEFWNAEVKKILHAFNGENYTEGIVSVVYDIGEALVSNFPYEKEDRNELPDDIVFGK